MPSPHMQLRLDRVGMSQVLSGAGVTAAVTQRARGVASVASSNPAVAGNGIPVAVDTFTFTRGGPRFRSPRAGASVTLKHAAGLPVEAKYGVLARAAGMYGLDVNVRVR